MEPWACPHHFAESVLHTEKHAAEIDGDDPVECRRVELRDWKRRVNDAGVIERAVEPAEAFDGCGDELLDVGLDGHVRPYEKTISAGPIHEIERFACRLFVDVADRHVGTAGNERITMTPAISLDSLFRLYGG